MLATFLFDPEGVRDKKTKKRVASLDIPFVSQYEEERSPTGEILNINENTSETLTSNFRITKCLFFFGILLRLKNDYDSTFRPVAGLLQEKLRKQSQHGGHTFLLRNCTFRHLDTL